MIRGNHLFMMIARNLSVLLFLRSSNVYISWWNDRCSNSNILGIAHEAHRNHFCDFILTISQEFASFKQYEFSVGWTHSNFEACWIWVASWLQVFTNVRISLFRQTSSADFHMNTTASNHLRTHAIAFMLVPIAHNLNKVQSFIFSLFVTLSEKLTLNMKFWI